MVMLSPFALVLVLSLPTGVSIVPVAILIAVIVATAIVVRLDRSTDWGVQRRTRLLLGLPWGTLVSILGVLLVYLFVQSGYEHWHAPVTVAFRSTSYFYPLGMIVAPFAHNGPGHLIGNLLATVVFGSLAEYAWGHFPSARGSSTFSRPRTNPYVRAFVLFPAGVVLVGLLTSLFSWGPLIGFSGVVYAFAGFALTRFPLATVIALTVEDVVRVAYLGLTNPVVTAQARPQFVTPWWAGIAVQGHVLGLLLGVTIGAVTYRRRRESPGAFNVWAATVIVATSLSIWAIWWFRGNNEFVLYRGLGVVFVVVLALLVTLGLRANTIDWTAFSVPGRVVGTLVLLFPILAIGFSAVPLNLVTVGDASVPGDGPGVQVRDYSVTYAENVTDQMTGVVNLSILGESTTVRTSGVIVISEERHLWLTTVQTSRLAFTGRVAVRVGGPGWRETVLARRHGWTVTGGGTAYRVQLSAPGQDWRTAFLSDPAVAGPVLNGTRVRVRPTDDAFLIGVRRNDSVVEAPVPQRNETLRLAGISFVRRDNAVYATFDDTRIRIARRETYR